MNWLVWSVCVVATILCSGLVAGALLDRDPSFGRGARAFLIAVAVAVIVLVWSLYEGWVA